MRSDFDSDDASRNRHKNLHKDSAWSFMVSIDACASAAPQQQAKPENKARSHSHRRHKTLIPQIELTLEL